MFTTRRGLLAPQNTFLETVLRRCDGPNSCFLLANARILEFPIVYASAGFVKLTGFSRIEVLQKPGLCPFLHGPQTSKAVVDTFENAFKEQKLEQGELILYKKNLNARWIVLRLVPIKNEQDSVVLFLLTFRDVTANRQPVEDDLAANSALGAFAAASDPGSSWGRFARLVFSMVRQRTGSMTEREEGTEGGAAGNTNGNPETDATKKTSEPLCTSGESANPETNQSRLKSNKSVKRDSLPNTCDETEELSFEQHQRLTKQHTEHSKSECVKVAERTNFLELQRLEEAMCRVDDIGTALGPPKRSFLRRLLRPRRNVVHTSVSDATSFGSSTKRTGSTRLTNQNTDNEDYSNNHWLSPETVPKYRLEPPCPPKHVLLHYSAFRLIWDWTILLLTGYTAVVVPLRLAIIPRPTWVTATSQTVDSPRAVNAWMRPSVPESLAIADAVIDIIFCLDIVLNFHTSFVGAGGEVVAEPPVIRVNYLSGWFTLDLISCLPYEIIKYCWSSENQELHSLLDGLRIIRLLRIGRAARRIDQYLEYVSTLLLLMIVCFFLLAHWFACAWYAVGVLDLENKIQYGWIPRYFNDSLRPQNWNAFIAFDAWDPNITHMDANAHPWIRKTRFAWNNPSLEKLNQPSMNKQFGLDGRTYRDLSLRKSVPLQNSVDKWSAYLTALYFSLSLLTTIGFGNVAAFTEAEKMLSICCMLIGALVYATIFGNVTTIVQQMYSTRTRYNEIMKGVKDFLRIHNVPQELGERVIDYITSSWSVNKGIDTAKVLNYCPKDMQADISVHLNRCVFNSHPAFRLASDGCRRSLAVNFQTLHTAPGDLIFHQGESVDQLCFIASGSLEVLQDDEVIAILGKGDVFGNPSWRNTVSVPSAASVRALTYCTLHTIRLERLRAVLQFYHAFSNSFTRNLELTHNLCNRVIFRKLADVKREMELSMRRNKDPPLSSLPAGHPVRKLISRLRRPSQAGDFSLRQGLSTIMSGESSFDASEPENSSISGSTLAEQSKSRQPSTISAAPVRPGSKCTNSEPNVVPPSCVSSPSRISSERNESVSSINVVPPLNSNCQSTTVTKAATGMIERAAGGTTNPARRWARLISKATQPKLQNLSEEAIEQPEETGANSTVANTTSVPTSASVTTTTTTVIATTSAHSSVTSKDQTASDETNKLVQPKLTTVDLQTLRELLLPLQRGMTSMHEDLQQQLSQVIQRIDRLEGQVIKMSQRIPQPASSSNLPRTSRSSITEMEQDIITVHRPRVRLHQMINRQNESDL